MKKVPLIRIGVKRDGKTVYPEIGKSFDFTKEEIADVAAMSKAAGKDYMRDPVNEDTAATPAPTAEKPVKGKPKVADAPAAPADEM